MQTIKTAVVVVLLLVVLYGSYIAINGSEAELPPELQAMMSDNLDLDVDMNMGPSGGFNSGGFNSNSPSNSNPFGSGPSGSSLTGPNGAMNSTLSATTGIPSQFATAPSASTFGTPTFGGKSSSLSTDGASNRLTSTPAVKDPGELGIEMPASPKPLSASSNANTPSAPPMLTTSNEPINSLDEKIGLSTHVPSKGVFTGGSSSATSSDEGMDSEGNSISMDDSESHDSEIPSTDSSKSKSTITGRSYENAKQVALEQIDRGQLKEALATLSVFYGSPELSTDQTRDLIDMLDSLAGETIYSRRHLLDTPYVVGPNETLEQIAKQFEIPTELLAKINAISNPSLVSPGTKLKVFKGPFRAEIDVKNNEMTLFLNDLYAGRFPVSTGTDPQPVEGVFQVLDKQRNRNYYGKGGLQIDGTDPRNPFGGWWIDLGQDVSIHGTSLNPGSEATGLGCISLSPLDASDVYSMLSRGSQVTIRR